MCDDHPHGHVHVPHIEPDVPPEAFTGEVLALEPVDAVTITTICDNSVDMLLTDQGPATRFRGAGGAPPLDAPTMLSGEVADVPVAQHGFSALVTVRKGDRTHRILFDTGVTPNGALENMARLDIDPGDIEVIVCSHGHFDHAAGLSGLATRLGRVNLPVLIHPEFWNRRRIAVPGRDAIELPTTSRRGLTDAGFDIVESRRPSFLFERSVLITGEVDRTTPFETGMKGHEAHRRHGWEPDPLILDDQALILRVRDHGLLVLTGCGHAGIVNILRYARRLTGLDQIELAMGGFHLGGPQFERIIEPTCDALVELAPTSLVPAHCTGWKASHALAARLPDAFIPNSVGTAFAFA